MSNVVRTLSLAFVAGLAAGCGPSTSPASTAGTSGLQMSPAGSTALPAGQLPASIVAQLEQLSKQTSGNAAPTADDYTNNADPTLFPTPTPATTPQPR